MKNIKPRARPAAGNRVAGRCDAVLLVGPIAAAVAADGAQIVAVAVEARTTVIVIFSCAACHSASSSIWRLPSRTVFWRWPGRVAVGRPDYRRHLHHRQPMTDRNRRTHRSYTWWDRYYSRHRPSNGLGNRPGPWSWMSLWISRYSWKKQTKMKRISKVAADRKYICRLASIRRFKKKYLNITTCVGQIDTGVYRPW